MRALLISLGALAIAAAARPVEAATAGGSAATKVRAPPVRHCEPSAVNHRRCAGKGHGGRNGRFEVERVQQTFQKITVGPPEGGPSASDNWAGTQPGSVGKHRHKPRH